MTTPPPIVLYPGGRMKSQPRPVVALPNVSGEDLRPALTAASEGAGIPLALALACAIAEIRSRSAGRALGRCRRNPPGPRSHRGREIAPACKRSSIAPGRTFLSGTASASCASTTPATAPPASPTSSQCAARYSRIPRRTCGRWRRCSAAPWGGPAGETSPPVGGTRSWVPSSSTTPGTAGAGRSVVGRAPGQLRQLPARPGAGAPAPHPLTLRLPLARHPRDRFLFSPSGGCAPRPPSGAPCCALRGGVPYRDAVPG